MSYHSKKQSLLGTCRNCIESTEINRAIIAWEEKMEMDGGIVMEEKVITEELWAKDDTITLVITILVS